MPFDLDNVPKKLMWTELQFSFEIIMLVWNFDLTIFVYNICLSSKSAQCRIDLQPDALIKLSFCVRWV